jgi:hypothetical protein
MDIPIPWTPSKNSGKGKSETEQTAPAVFFLWLFLESTAMFTAKLVVKMKKGEKPPCKSLIFSSVASTGIEPVSKV